jgi:enamine deaminase RidA (YjgF/YER057c/UK114 family)
VVYLSGQVGDLAPEVLESSDVAAQTRQTLAKIDKALAEASTSKRHILRTEGTEGSSPHSSKQAC